MRPLKHGDILGQVLFMDTPESTQEVAQAGPNAFQRVAMNLAYPIAIIISGILANGMTHRPVPATCAARGLWPTLASAGRTSQAFIDFVLTQYVRVGVDELASDKLTPLLRLKYHNAIADAVADLGQPDEINQVFAGFQKYLYQPQVAA